MPVSPAPDPIAEADAAWATLPLLPGVRLTFRTVDRRPVPVPDGRYLLHTWDGVTAARHRDHSAMRHHFRLLAFRIRRLVAAP